MKPTPPENVRIVRRDGTEIPCEVRYLGERISEDGEPVHDWAALSEYSLNIDAGDRLKVDVFPPRSGLQFIAVAPGDH